MTDMRFVLQQLRDNHKVKGWCLTSSNLNKLVAVMSDPNSTEEEILMGLITYIDHIETAKDQLLSEALLVKTMQVPSKVIFDWECGWEGLSDLIAEVSDAFDHRYNPEVKDLPMDTGTFNTVITWRADIEPG